MNKSLQASKDRCDDEFFTKPRDIKAEVERYDLKGKTVLCNCNDMGYGFDEYFTRNMADLGIPHVIVLSYDELGCGAREDLYLKGRGTVQSKLTVLDDNGSFDGPSGLAALEEADVVITNPPFSRFTEFLLLCMSKCDVLIIGNKNAVTYRDVFPLIKEGKLRLGYRHMNSDMDFWIRDVGRAEKTSDGKPVRHIMACWYTTLPVHACRRVTEVRQFDPAQYPRYDELDAVNVDRTSDIPKGYDGLMGVPVSYLAYHDPKRYEIVGHAGSTDGPYSMARELHIDGRKTYKRIIIRKRDISAGA